MSLLFNYMFGSIDTTKNLHESINWNNSVIAGSYALHQFVKDANWSPNDIDIMIACKDTREFEAEAKKFQNNTKSTLKSQNYFKPGQKGTGDDELFDTLVLASKTYELPNYNNPVQLICLHSPDGASPTEILSKTTDIPACVSYSMFDGNKIFHIPEKGCEILLTNRGRIDNICSRRLEKYKKRGYTFYSP